MTPVPLVTILSETMPLECAMGPEVLGFPLYASFLALSERSFERALPHIYATIAEMPTQRQVQHLKLVALLARQRQHYKAVSDRVYHGARRN
jgi:hypothetical protein